MLHGLGCLLYSPPLESHIRQHKILPAGSNWEIELRGTSIWCVELIRQEIMRKFPDAQGGKGAEATATATPSPQPGSGIESRDAASDVDVEAPAIPQPAGSAEDAEGGDEEERTDSVVTRIQNLKLATQNHARELDNAEGEERPKRKRKGVNAILIDFFLYDTMKDLEREGKEGIPHHRTRSIWY